MIHRRTHDSDVEISGVIADRIGRHTTMHSVVFLIYIQSEGQGGVDIRTACLTKQLIHSEPG